MKDRLRFALPILICLISIPAQAQDENGSDQSAIAAYAFAITDNQDLRSARGELETALRDALASNSRFSSIEADRRIHGLTEANSEDLERALSTYESALELYNNLELESAIENFNQSIEIYEENIGHLDDINTLSDCLLYIGATQILLGNTRAARTTFQRLLVFDPERRPDENIFPPPVTDAFDYVAERMARVREGGIRILSTPEGADVYVDGRYQGPSPQEVSGLKEGRHYVRVRAPGYIEMGQVVEVRRGQTNDVEFDFEHTDNGEAISGILAGLPIEIRDSPADASTSVSRLGELLSVRYILTATLSAGEQGVVVQLDVWDVATGRSVAQSTVGPMDPDPVRIASEVQVSANEILTSDWDTSTTEQAIDEPIVEVIEDEDPEPLAPPIWRQWWFWTAIGAVVVATGVGIGVGVAASGDDPAPTTGEVLFDL